jgi:hypothetical protein
MTPCDACKALDGMPSSMPPHGDLSATGSHVAGAGAHAVKRDDEYRCTVCGNSMIRNTAQGEPPGVWRLQGRSGG